MKLLSAALAASFLTVVAVAPAMAQTKPSSNATALGGATAPSNQEGAPAATTPQGQIGTTAVPAPTKFPPRARRAAARTRTTVHPATPGLHSGTPAAE